MTITGPDADGNARLDAVFDATLATGVDIVVLGLVRALGSPAVPAANRAPHATWSVRRPEPMPGRCRPSRMDARRRVCVAAVLGAVALASSGCGAQGGLVPLGSGGQAGGAGSAEGARSSPAASCRASTPAGGPVTGGHAGEVEITNVDNGATICATQGSRVAVYLRGTARDRWTIVEDGSALRPAASGRGALPVGVTGRFFVAARPGTAHVTGVRGACHTPAAGPPTCDAEHAFAVTVVVR